MAISVNNEPYNWMVRGQKLLIIAESDESTQPGFRFGVEIIIDAKTYTFYLSPAPDGNMYFDLQPLLDDLRNHNPQGWHFSTDSTQNDLSYKLVTGTLTEWWTVGGVLTLNAGSEYPLAERIAINGYFQVLDGLNPNVETGGENIQYTLLSQTNYTMSDRKWDTHTWKLARQWTFNPNIKVIWIPAWETDYGLMGIPGNSSYLYANLAQALQLKIVDSSGTSFINTPINLSGFNIEALPIYPANLNDWAGLTVKPSLFPNWRYYEAQIIGAGVNRSIAYRFYNVARYGQTDCKYERIRLGWVNSRGGWDYFNFIKKSELTNEIERKKYRKVLWNGTATVFDSNHRGLVERRNIVEQVLVVTSDFIQQGEFTFLRSLLVSNQVVWLTDRFGKPIEIPVNLDDTSYMEKNTKDGKRYNVTFKVRMANEYWT